MSTSLRLKTSTFKSAGVALMVAILVIAALVPVCSNGQERDIKESTIVCVDTVGNAERLIEIGVKSKKIRTVEFRKPLPWDVGDLSLSPDGKSLLYNLPDGPFDVEKTRYPSSKIWVRSLETPTDEPTNLGTGGAGCCWSPDSKQVLMLVNIGCITEGAGACEYQFVDIESKKLTTFKMPKLENLDGEQTEWKTLITDWSRDGQWLLAISFKLEPNETAKTRIDLLKPDGSAARQLKHIKSGTHARFSPDSKRIVYSGPHSKERNNSDLFVVNLDGGDPVRVSEAFDGTVDSFCWSPDGLRIAYRWWKQDENLDYESFVIVGDATGGNWETIASEKRHTFAGVNWR
jgi:Tol biopolymer transport system component